MRDAISTGYRMHTGGRWAGQCQFIGVKASAEVEKDTGRMSYVHSVSEIYIPGSAADDPEQFPTFPVAVGTLRERLAGGQTLETTPATKSRNLEELQTEHYETLVSSERESSPEDLNPASNTGGDDADDEGDSRAEKTQVAVDHDTWTIEGDYLVRTHRVPRTTLFRPLDSPDATAH